MKPTLYRSYTRSEIDAFLPEGPTPVAAGDAFLVTPTRVLGLVRVGTPERTFYFRGPGELIWTPGPGGVDVLGKNSFFDGVGAAFLPTGSVPRWLFVTDDGTNYQYVGKFMFGMCSSNSRDERRVYAPNASAHLSPKLPRDAWARYGSYLGWKANANARLLYLPEGADVAAALRPESDADVFELFLTRYEDDVFHLVANGNHATVSYCVLDRGLWMHSRNADYTGDAEESVVLTGFYDDDWETNASQAIPRAEALRLLKEFVATGEPRGLVPYRPDACPGGLDICPDDGGQTAASFAEINRLVADGADEFLLFSYSVGNLVVFGSFDVNSYHDVELTFHGVKRIHCPTSLRDPVFRDEGPAESGRRRYAIESGGKRYEIVARGVTVSLGRVYHYDRANLQPGERIADWVKGND
jgi:hypothetical protein